MASAVALVVRLGFPFHDLDGAFVKQVNGDQRADGGWDEEHFTGTGFPRDFLINYHLYRIVWPVWALGRVRSALR